MTRLLLALLIVLMTALHPSAAGVLTIVAPAAPGGGWDQTARVMQQILARVEPGTNVQVENVPGAAGTIGLARFVSGERGNPDALMITGLVMVSGIVSNHSPVTLADTTPIARLTGEYEVIVVPAASRWHTMEELVAAFRAEPRRVAWGGGSAGGTDDLLVRLIAEGVGVEPDQANYVAFPGGGAALAALLGGQLSAGVSGYGEFAGQIAAGTLRLLAVSSRERVPGIDAPTLRESGIDLDLANWRGIVAPPGLTDAERDGLTQRIAHMASRQEWRDVLTRNGWADLLLTGPAFRQFLLAEQSRVESLFRRLESKSSATKGRSVRLTSRTVPMAAAIVLAGLVLFRGVSWRPTARTTGTMQSPRPAISLMVTLLVYSIAMPSIGFIPASTLLFVIAARLLGSVRVIRDVAVGLVTASVLFVAFTFGLGLGLPTDPLTRWLAP